MMNNEQQYAEKPLILRMTKTYGGFLSRSAQDDKGFLWRKNCSEIVFPLKFLF